MATEKIVTTANNPFVIPNPSLAFVNFMGEAGKHLMESDYRAFGNIFQNVQVDGDALQRCNVLFLYADLQTGSQGRRFRDIVGKFGAHIAVLASELSPALLSDREFTNGLSEAHAWPANIVITLNRNGHYFGRFFHQLFSLMRTGLSMPMAWVELAPQGPPEMQRKDIPATLCLLQAGHIAFGQKKSEDPLDIRPSTADRF